MEDFVYIILLVLWLVVSLYKKKSKNKAATAKEATETVPPPVEKDLGELLEEFLGGGQSKSQPKPDYDPEPSETILAEAAEPDYFETWQQEKQSLEEIDTSMAEYTFQGEAPREAFQSAEIKAETIEDLIREHAAEDARRQAAAELAYADADDSEIPEFDLRTAIIFSEVLNKKYH